MAIGPDDLLRRARRGEAAAFEQLVAGEQRRLFGLAFRMCGDPHEAEDLVQEGLLKAYCALANFRGDANFTTWLYRIVANTVLDTLRRRKRQPVDPVADPGEFQESGCAPPPDSPEEGVLQRERVDAVGQALRSLREEFRVSVVLRDVYGLSYEEIGEVLDIPLGTVKSRIARGRLELRAALTGSELFGDSHVERVEEGGAAGGVR